MDHVHPTISCKLSFQCARECRVELEQEQMRIRGHSSRDLTRVHPFTRTVFRDHPRLGEIHFTGHPFYHRLGAGNN